MKNPTINLHDLLILIADPNSYTRRIIQGMLRGFGANKLLEVGQSSDLLQTLIEQKVDALILDVGIVPPGGLALTRAIRRKKDNQNCTLPILVMTNDLREATIRDARDAGANMVIAKPMSPKDLYDRLAWIAFSPRKFVDSENYFGPDRRFKIEGYPGGVGRRKEDNVIEVADEAGPALAQDDIDNLFSATRTG
jgi:two-component system, chemotaxis family, chemotaxis protein CheY